ncbi:PTS sugar transporter subunit IIB [Vagococcus sp. BWB3-3]|uniref:PTS sugar transporter subunit IIB n=1 Tax=Vagococcus allomyrinae TaxID=2794353 RepID=A0A940PE41_9ENTE|nr:mannose/fructose/sorbose PTS transporter subunit IIB [Vagococcus allomyrinae]MBP1041138.1 PTS sugar transporter subunit IIB [Vagococcus allomyrinae]
MIIELARIDDRFIHGQVLTKWVKLRPVERIIIVSDAVANDEMRKTLVLSVAPSNIKASAVSVDKMARAYKSPKYANTKAMLLFENPEDILRLVQQDVDIKEVNIGGMRFETDRKQITKAVSVKETDIKAFEELSKLAIKLELRQLPGDQSVDFMKTLKSELKK